MKITRKTNFKERFLMGEKDGEKIFLSPPSWGCDWYWGFGYLGNENCHYHISGLSKSENLFDAIKIHFGDSLMIEDDNDLWIFCELVSTFYTLKNTAEVLGRGGAHYCDNPVKKDIQNTMEANRLNNKVMPSIFDAMQEILDKYPSNK